MTKTDKLGDILAVWDLSDPKAPSFIGTTSLVAQGRSLAFQYDRNWLANGFAISGDLPLRPEPFVPSDRDQIPGALEDAKPDRWGERAIRFLENPPRVSPLDLLYLAGDDRFGCLGFSIDQSIYVPHPRGPLASLESLETLEQLIKRIRAAQPLDEQEKLLASTTKTMGGAHPKALLDMNGKEWIAKFPRDSNIDTGLVEHATMRLAQNAGIVTAETVPIPAASGHIVAVARFDRKGGLRIRSASANTALMKGLGNGLPALEELSYGAMGSLLQQVAPKTEIEKQRVEVFKRMAFNILIENSDDHEKNHAFVFADGHWSLSPAFDILPLTTNIWSQGLVVGENGADPSLENALSQCHLFGLSREEAIEIWFGVAAVVDKWEEFYSALGVTGKDIEYLRQFIDHPTRKEMRSREIVLLLPKPESTRTTAKARRSRRT